MRLFIPDIGTQIQLTQDWKFDLHFEIRNKSMGEALKATTPPRLVRSNVFLPGAGWWEPLTFTEITLPAGTLLKVDRVYIRKGANLG